MTPLSSFLSYRLICEGSVMFPFCGVRTLIHTWRCSPVLDTFTMGMQRSRGYTLNAHPHMQSYSHTDTEALMQHTCKHTHLTHRHTHTHTHTHAHATHTDTHTHNATMPKEQYVHSLLQSMIIHLGMSEGLQNVPGYSPSLNQCPRVFPQFEPVSQGILPVCTNVSGYSPSLNQCPRVFPQFEPVSQGILPV